MGPVVSPQLDQWLLRPFQSSATFQWLRAHPVCVFHVVDDALAVARTVLGLDPELEFERIDGGWVIQSCCHWYQLRIREWDVSQPRSQAVGELSQQGVCRPFWGWNRAKHAILEASILITRLHLLDRDHILQELDRLETTIQKTAGPDEWEAWRLLREHVHRQDV